MIPSYLHDLALPNVFAQYTKQVESYLLPVGGINLVHT